MISAPALFGAFLFADYFLFRSDLNKRPGFGIFPNKILITLLKSNVYFDFMARCSLKGYSVGFISSTY